MSVRFNFVLSDSEAGFLFEAIKRSGYDSTYITSMVKKMKSTVDHRRLLKARQSLISALHYLDLATE